MWARGGVRWRAVALVACVACVACVELPAPFPRRPWQVCSSVSQVAAVLRDPRKAWYTPPRGSNRRSHDEQQPRQSLIMCGSRPPAVDSPEDDLAEAMSKMDSLADML